MRYRADSSTQKSVNICKYDDPDPVQNTPEMLSHDIFFLLTKVLINI